jgi:hypothetical protein
MMNIIFIYNFIIPRILNFETFINYLLSLIGFEVFMAVTKTVVFWVVAACSVVG